MSPQASPEQRAKWTDESARDLLEDRGYKLTARFCWLRPPGHEPTADEEGAAAYLIDEWDYGPIVDRDRDANPS